MAAQERDRLVSRRRQAAVWRSPGYRLSHSAAAASPLPCIPAMSENHIRVLILEFDADKEFCRVMRLRVSCHEEAALRVYPC